MLINDNKCWLVLNIDNKYLWYVQKNMSLGIISFGFTSSVSSLFLSNRRHSFFASGHWNDRRRPNHGVKSCILDLLLLTNDGATPEFSNIVWKFSSLFHPSPQSQNNYHCHASCYLERTSIILTSVKIKRKNCTLSN